MPGLLSGIQWGLWGRTGRCLSTACYGGGEEKNPTIFEGEAPYDKTVPATPEEQPASSSFMGCSGEDSNLQLNHGCCSLSSTAASVPSC